MSKTKFNRVIDMTRLEYKAMVSELKHIQSLIEGHMRDDEDNEPSIDVRLCIDFEGLDPNWIILFGDASYDQRHSELCGASSVSQDTVFNDEADETLEDLIDQCLEQLSERGES